MDALDIFDWCMEHFVIPFFTLFIVGGCALCIVGLFCVPSCIKEEKQKQQQIEECYMQTPKTKECEYLLWQYELDKKQPRSRTAVVPMVMPAPVVIH